MEKKLLGSFYEKELQKTNQKEFRIEKEIKRKEANYMPNGKDIATYYFMAGLIKRILLNESVLSTILKFRKKIKVELDLSSYATKTDLKNVTHVDVSSFASKTNLANLKTQVDNLDIAKLTTVPDDLAKSSNVLKNDVVKKTEHDNFVDNIKK